MASVWLETHGKAILVRGDTMQIKDFLKTKGAKWNGGLKSWLFPGSKKAVVMQDLQNCSLVTKVEDRTGTSSAASSSDKPAEKAPAAAAQAPKKRTETDPESQVIDLDDNVRVEVSAYQGKLGVDVRRLFTDKASGEKRLSPKGLRMSEQEWEAVCAVTERIDSMLKEANETSWSVEGDMMVSITGGSVDLRRYYTDKNDGEKKPGKQGIRLSGMQWASLKAEMANATSMLKDLGSTGGKAKKQKKQKKTADQPAQPEESEEHKMWRTEIKKIVEGKDLTQLSLRKVREQLEETLGVAKDHLMPRKDEVNNIVKQIVAPN